MKSSILKEAISAMFVKKPGSPPDSERANSTTLELSSDTSSSNSPSRATSLHQQDQLKTAEKTLRFQTKQSPLP